MNLKKWFTIKNMKFERKGFGVCIYNSKIFIFGGFSANNEEVKSIEIYDPV